MAFRIGRKHAQHIYPLPRGPGEAQAFARNYASGPETNEPITGDPLEIPWFFVEAGAPADPKDVPITPVSTGIVLLTGNLIVASENENAPVIVQVEVVLNGTPIAVPQLEFAEIPTAPGPQALAYVSIPIHTELRDPSGDPLPIGVEANVRIRLLGLGNSILLGDGSTLTLQEVVTASG